MISIRREEEVNEGAEQLKVLSTMMAAILISISGMLSLMILVNLSNILVENRMKELLVMRVNGFSFKQVIGYLARETVMTTGMGIAVGVVAGIPFSKLMLIGFEGSMFMYARKPYAIAWLAAALFNVVFAVLINGYTFSKVRKRPLTSVSGL
ncbi:MAG: ABC transporter permease [Lachnospiraceae bacterium]|nr:ABC transporter permease [Lachnospiraceae bacterium]